MSTTLDDGRTKAWEAVRSRYVVAEEYRRPSTAFGDERKMVDGAPWSRCERVEGSQRLLTESDYGSKRLEHD